MRKGHWESIEESYALLQTLTVSFFSAARLLSSSTLHYTTLRWRKFGNAALFLRLGLLSTLICLESRAFRKHSSSQRRCENAGFCFHPDGRQFENGVFTERWHHVHEFSSNTDHKWLVIVGFSNFSRNKDGIQIGCVFRVKCRFEIFLAYWEWGAYPRRF